MLRTICKNINNNYHRSIYSILSNFKFNYKKQIFSSISTSRMSNNSNSSAKVSFIDQKTAAAIDQDLMSPEYGFSIDQLMELAGLSCAAAIHAYFPPHSNTPNSDEILVICGPGNNGGDALVCARHLWHFGFSNITIVYPKKTDKKLYLDLLTQCKQLNMKIVEELPNNLSPYRFAIDGIFGFSFDLSNGIREPFKTIIERLVESKLTILSIDIPSSWHVETGDLLNIGIKPEMLISLTVPKQCAEYFKGKIHVCGGRFVPTNLAKKYNIHLPKYNGRELYSAL